MPSTPLTNSVMHCGTDSVILSAIQTGTGMLKWYDSPIGGNLLGTGLNFTTPILSTNTTYYVQNAIETPSLYTGKPDDSGPGSNFANNGSHYLVFDTYAPVKLVSVKVYAYGAGNRTIELQDNTANTIQSLTINIPDGESRIDLNLDLPVASNLRLVGPPVPNLFRNMGVTGYPYEIASLVSIKHSSAGTDPTGYYYYFYDWEVKEADCSSPRMPINAFMAPEPPTAIFNIVNNDPVVQFNDASIYPALYYWDFGDGNTSTQANPSHWYTVDGTYTVKLKIINGCGEDSTTQSVMVNSSGINENIADFKLNIYPNPTSDNININIDINEASSFKIELLDMIGRTLLNQDMDLFKGNNIYSVDLSSYSKGVFFIRISDKNNSVTRKIIHQ